MTGAELKAIRNTLGVTQQEMAVLLFLCNRSYVCDLEAGRKKISARVAKIAKFLDTAV